MNRRHFFKLVLGSTVGYIVPTALLAKAMGTSTGKPAPEVTKPLMWFKDDLLDQGIGPALTFLPRLLQEPTPPPSAFDAAVQQAEQETNDELLSLATEAADEYDEHDQFNLLDLSVKHGFELAQSRREPALPSDGLRSVDADGWKCILTPHLLITPQQLADTNHDTGMRLLHAEIRQLCVSLDQLIVSRTLRQVKQVTIPTVIFNEGLGEDKHAELYTYIHVKTA